MKRIRGFTLIEMLIVMAVIAILIRIALPAVRGMQNEAKISKAQGELHTLRTAMETYNSMYGTLPSIANSDIQDTLLNMSPNIIQSKLYDPFNPSGNTEYLINTNNGPSASAYDYYVFYSVGTKGNGTAAIDSNGTVTVTNGAIWDSNGHI